MSEPGSLAPPPAPPGPGFIGRLWRRFRRAHRRENRENLQGWVDLICGYLAVVAVLLGASWTVGSWSADYRTSKQAVDAARSGPDLKADLKLATVRAYIGKGIKGTEEQFGGLGAAGRQKADISGPHVEITVQNLATAPSLITEANVTFRKSLFLEGCYTPTSEGLRSTATYDLTVPDKQPLVPGTHSHKVPFSRTAELTHRIDANSYEKFTLTTGPEIIDYGDSPWVGVFDVELVHDGGRKLKAGRVAVISPGGDSRNFYPVGETWHIDPEHIPGCQKLNTEVISKVLEPGVVASRELKALDQAFRSYTPGRHSPGPDQSGDPDDSDGDPDDSGWIPAAPVPGPT
ncbi:hypothetical protein QQY66_15205 [Streptomyces sp. DG2A-72]|uniref:hypothetical protein n=1 Tax=Streptomyces sp. DG2A-72 TaxID=3051386 RepID=UPI00265B976D|nr:hypothetical protein [Streptomyces sp. DG2A-72]MDO0932974.1 hypothetical protein [Streptomyces sp. DG2A-72]